MTSLLKRQKAGNYREARPYLLKFFPALTWNTSEVVKIAFIVHPPIIVPAN